MINWEITFSQLGYDYDLLPKSKRPMVICQCDHCHKTKPIRIRVKSKIVKGQMAWLCPACVKLRDSDHISKQMTELWQNEVYRNHQLSIKSDANYIKQQSIAGKARWLDTNYRSKIEKNIEPSEYIDRSIIAHGDIFDYSTSNFRKWHDRIDVSCKACSLLATKDPQKHLIHGYCQRCGISKGQREILQYIEHMGCDAIVNDRCQLNGLELDIFIKSHSLAIEYHGLYWHSFGQKESKEDIHRHQTKALNCHKAQIRLLQFYDFEWINKQTLVRSMISNALGKSEKHDARKMSISMVDNASAERFFNQNHIYGHRPAKTTVALTQNGEIYAAMSLSKNTSGYEIIRLAYKTGSTIRGGASKLLFFVTRNISSSISTFADLRYSIGGVYEHLGFKKIKITSPGYFYYKQNGCDYLMLSRQQCQKHKLSRILEAFDPKLSESQNMFNNGYRRVWNAGNILYRLGF
jgi:hypothetical protein